MKKLFVSIAIAALCSTAEAGFLNGNNYRALGDSQRLGYVEGMIDGMLSAGAMAHTKLARADQLNLCLGNMHADAIQARAIVDRYINANPAYWGDDMANLVWPAMQGACRATGSSLD